MKIRQLLFVLFVLAASALISAVPARAQTAPAAPNSAATNPLPTLWLIGDSTVRNGGKGLMGWGDPIKDLFDPTKIRVMNNARGGRSSRTFYTEGLWTAVQQQMQPGDFLLMQFGHNDGGSVDGAKATGRASLKGNGDDTKDVTLANGTTETVHSYGWYLRQYIEGAKAKGAFPIVLSMIPRNDWKDGKVARANEGYGLWAKQAADAENVPFVDLNGIIADHYDALGQTQVAAYFPFEHTHTNPDGAKLNAQCVVDGLKGLPNCPLVADLKVESPTGQ